MYTIKDLADLAGTTTRTLRYYDQLGLLTPAVVGSNGYRYYDRGNLLTLQQILFFRELDVPLKEIHFLINQPGFEILPSLINHREALLVKRQRYEELIDTIDKTIQHLQGDLNMSENELFSGFDEQDYAGETRDRWGNTAQYQESYQKWSAYSEEQKEEIKRLGGEIAARMVTDSPQSRPDDPGVQQAVAEYYQYLKRYFYHCEVEFLRNLADMWEQDPRFAINYERIREGGAKFARQAVHFYCDRHQEAS